MYKLAVSIVVLGSILISGAAIMAGFQEDPGKRILENYSDSVFRLTPIDRRNTGGTGFLLELPSHNRVVITNAHVCGLSSNGQMTAHLRDGSEVITSILAISDSTDLCLLERIPNIRPFKLARELKDFYSRYYILGHPHLEPATLSEGFIVGHTRTIKIANEKPLNECRGKMYTIEMAGSLFDAKQVCMSNVNAIGSSIVVYPGNSGSPTLNGDGEVVGVLFASNNRDNYGLFVPLNDLELFLKESNRM